MKRILCLIDTLGFGGGAERQMAGLAGMLRQRGLDVTLATYHRHDMDEFLQKEYGMRSVLLDVRSNPWSKLMAVRQFIGKERFDTVIAYKDGPTVICCLLKLLGMKFRLIVSERNTTQRLTRRERLKFLLYRWADVIVPNSLSQGEFISKNYHRLASKTVVITNFTDTSHFVPAGTVKQTGMIKVLTVARIASQKNVRNYLQAIKRVAEQRSDVVFEWYGNTQIGEDDYRRKCMETVIELGLERKIVFCPATSDVAEVYQSCDVFCLPSLYEGFPNALCEAMSCGKPVLCSRVCDNPAIVCENVNGMMFDPGNVEDMSQAILRMIALPEEVRKAMGEKSRELAMERFSEKPFVDRYIRLIENKTEFQK